MGKNDLLRRKRPHRKPFARFLLVCEGKVTEPRYFKQLRHEWRSHVNLEIVPGAGVPISVVQEAIARRDEAISKAKSEHDSNLKFDEVWCVFDRDDHPRVDEARTKAAQKGFKVAFSNPCFELWLLLHFCDQTAHIARDTLRTECQTHLPGYDKLIPTGRIACTYQDALRRASDLSRWHQSRGTSFENPYTDVYELTEQIRVGTSK